MARICLNQKKRGLFLSVITVLLFFYIEVLLYKFTSFEWLNLKCGNGKLCTKILLVADPQILGLYNDGYLSAITYRDSDRFLKSTYLQAYDFTKPDVVIFLGDLMDEASTAKSTEEFNTYVRRLFNIFLNDDQLLQRIWLPGDNDIGGEGFDLITSVKKERFARAFQQPDTITKNNITFYKINRLLQAIPVIKETRDFFNTDNIAVGLSHIPLLFQPGLFVDKILRKMQPHLLFTAHEHKSMAVAVDAVLRQDRQITPINPNERKIFKFSLAVKDIYEILVPTCNYRMGTPDIGYGYAIIENGELQYTVLWSPSRLHYLVVYLIYFGTLFTIFCISCCRKVATSKIMRYSQMPVEKTKLNQL